jgi:hypothetical protein
MATQTTASPTAAAPDDGTTEAERPSTPVMDAWRGFDEMLTWLELGDAAQARRAFLRALNAQ